MTIPQMPGAALTMEQWRLIGELSATLAPGQASWISGYFAGLDNGMQRAGAPLGLPAPAGAEPGAAVAAAAGRTLTILYGSETGNSAEVAAALGKAAREQGLSPTVSDMMDYKARKLKDEQDLLIVVSTHGEGDPPQAAADFFEFIEGRKAPKLPDLRYAMLALGDMTYEQFCGAGKRLDERLSELGAKPLRPRVDCDVDYDEPAATWTADILALLAAESAPAAASPVVRAVAAPAEAAAPSAYGKRNPFAATIIENLQLTGRGSTKETRHIEISLEGSGLTYAPGDALGVVTPNDPTLVESLLEALHMQADAPLAVRGQEVALGDALSRNFEITTATQRFLDHWAALTGAKDAFSAMSSAERADFLYGNHIIDIVRNLPLKGIDPQQFVDGLRPLQPRLYSISSSLEATPDEVHLTVSPVRYTLHGEPRSGVASGYLADHAEIDTTLPVYVQSNPHFRLPDDGAPIIMIGAGTGVAPYRAFMQEREVRGAEGRSWMIFGERNFRTDFLYQTEWQSWLKDEVLTRMDVAFSRDGAEKVYVQHRIREHARDIYAWLEEGAHVYVCGDATHLAPDVHEALLDVVEEQASLQRDAAEEYFRDLQRDRRYQRDVY